jgi:hypothetical protein
MESLFQIESTPKSTSTKQKEKKKKKKKAKSFKKIKQNKIMYLNNMFFS